MGEEPHSVAVGDFNGDGKVDLAVANLNSNTLSILLGDGTGNFSLASSPATGDNPQSVAVGDFNRDGKMDLAVANGHSNSVSILLGDGTGKFTLTSSPPTGMGPISVSVGDFNGDGKLDLAVANYSMNTLSILLGDGTGHFSLASSPGTGMGPASVAVGDFNGDGKLDLVVANYNGNTLSILLGDGTGNFNLVSSSATGVLPESVAVGDLNGDGKLDLVVPNVCGNDLRCKTVGTVSILLGDGTGNFTPVSSPATGTGPLSVALGAFNHDGRLDIAAANMDDNTVSILRQVPTVSLSPIGLIFGNQTVGTTSAPQTATVTNVGYAAVNISGVTISGTDSTDFSETNNCPSSLSVGASCTIFVTFTPVSGGSRTAAVSVSDDGSNQPQIISVMGTGLSVRLSATSLNFANEMVGKISQPQIVVLTNIGSTPLTITSIKTNGADPGDFSVSNTCGGSIRAGDSCNIVVRFIPTQTGPRMAAVGITDNGGGSPQKIKLRGTGT